MPRKIGAKRHRALLRDVFQAEHDVVALAEAHGLSPDDLAHWANGAANQRHLAGLCMLADTQTQLLLSRYRLLAAGRLAQLANQQKESTSDDVARKAAVDLLRLDLKRAEISPGRDAADGDAPDPQALRAMLYGDGNASDATRE